MTTKTQTPPKSKEFIKLCKSYDIDPNEVQEITSLQQAIEITGETPVFHESDTKDEIAYKKLKVIVKAHNMKDGKVWVPDYANPKEYKYEPLWYSSGSGLSYDYCVNWHSDSTVGSRLCSHKWQICKFIALHHIDLYTDYIA